MAKPEVIEKIKCAISHINKEGGAANFRAIAELINENTKLTNGTLVYLKTSGVVDCDSYGNYFMLSKSPEPEQVNLIESVDKTESTNSVVNYYSIKKRMENYIDKEDQICWKTLAAAIEVCEERGINTAKEKERRICRLLEVV